MQEKLVKEMTEKELRQLIREEVSKIVAPVAKIPEYFGKGVELYEPTRPKRESIFPEIIPHK